MEGSIGTSELDLTWWEFAAGLPLGAPSGRDIDGLVGCAMVPTAPGCGGAWEYWLYRKCSGGNPDERADDGVRP